MFSEVVVLQFEEAADGGLGGAWEDAMAEAADPALAAGVGEAADGIEDGAELGFEGIGVLEEPVGVDVALDGPAIGEVGEDLVDGVVPVDAEAGDGEAAEGVPVFGAGEFGVVGDGGGGAEVVEGAEEEVEGGDDVGAEEVGGEGAGAGVEHGDGVGAGLELVGHGAGEEGDEGIEEALVPAVGEAVEGGGEVAGVGAFDGVGEEGEGAADEAEEAFGGGEGVAEEAEGVGLEVEGLGDGWVVVEAAEVGGGMEVPAEGGGGVVVEGEAEGFEGEEDVGEEDGGVEVEVLDGAEGGFAGEAGDFAEVDEGMLAAEVLVMGMVATGLAHEPDRGAVGVAALEGGGEEAHGVGDGGVGRVSW